MSSTHSNTHRTSRDPDLSCNEAAMLLTTSVAEVRRLRDANILDYLDRPDRIDPESVRQRFPDDLTRKPREQSMARLLADEVASPTLASAEHAYSLHWVLASLIQATLPAGARDWPKKSGQHDY